MKTTMLLTLATLLSFTNLATAQDFTNYAPDVAYTAPASATPDIAAVSVYNYPENTKMVLDFVTQKSSTMKLKVYDNHGQEFASQTLYAYNGKQKLTLDLGKLYRGGYFLSLEGDDYKETRMFVVSR